MNLFLTAEFLGLFVVLPAVFIRRPLPAPPMPVLWAAALYACWVLPGGIRAVWNVDAVRRHWRPVIILFIPVAGVMTAAAWFQMTKGFLALPRERPGMWLLILFLYPPLSVVPQAFLYRAFLFERYRPLCESQRIRIWISAIVFSWMHVLFGNAVAPLLTLPAGLLFAWRYGRTRSLALSAFEHALYGCAVFTLGLGPYFHAS